MNDFQKKYLDETGHRLRRKGFTVLPKNEGVLQVGMAGVLLCHINMRSDMCYDADPAQRNGPEDALDQVRSIAVETQAYMRQMAAAPPLLAEGLSGNYRLLAEFNHMPCAGYCYQWLDEIEDERLLQQLMLLSADDIDLLTRLVFEGYTQCEIAQQKKQNQKSISRQFQQIRKTLEKCV